jgi:Fringe-like
MRLAPIKPRRTIIKWRFIGPLLILGAFLFNAAHLRRTIPSPLREEMETHSVMIPSQREDTVMIDVISIGSVTKIDFLQAQQASFGQYVRHFWSITEDADTSQCAMQLTAQQYCSVLAFCTSPVASNTSSTIGHFLTARLFRPKYGPIRPPTPAFKQRPTEQSCAVQDVTPQAIGWLCAQQRPLFGLRRAVEAYGTSIPLPHYLLIIDDDTYVNMNHLIPLLRTHYPYHEIHVLAGCVKHNPPKIHFSFPVGGFGTVLTRQALQQRLLRPMDCAASATQDTSSETERYRRFVCWQIQNNQFGERDYFQNNMSVADLYSHAARPYTEDWSRAAGRRGFCWHSDHVLAYFLNYYHIGQSAIPQVPLDDSTVPAHRAYRQLLLSTYGSNHSNYVMNSWQYLEQCEYHGDACDPTNSILCHNIPPEQMQSLWKNTSNTK